MRRRRLVTVLAAVAAVLATTFVAPLLAQAAAGQYVVRSLYNPRVSGAMSPPTASRNSHWQLSYVDDFNHGLNTGSAWGVYDAGPPSSNPDTAWFSAKHVTTSGGQMHINGYVDRSVRPDGRVVSGGLGLWHRPQMYGKYTMLVRMRACQDVKYAFMLWPYSNRWPSGGEVDFAEDEGGNRTLSTATTIFGNHDGSRGNLPQDYLSAANSIASWHVLGVEWTPYSISYTIDQRHWGSFKTTHLPRNPMVFVVQTEGKAYGSQVSLPGGTCNADFGWVAQYKYVP